MAPFSIMDLFDDVNGKLFAFEKKIWGSRG